MLLIVLYYNSLKSLYLSDICKTTKKLQTSAGVIYLFWEINASSISF